MFTEEEKNGRKLFRGVRNPEAFLHLLSLVFSEY